MKTKTRTVFGTPVTRKNLGTGFGKGNGGNTPNLPVIRPVELTDFIRRGIAAGHLEPDCKLYKMGKCSIMVGTQPGNMLHLSIAHPERYPSWDEVAKARYELLPENITVAMLLPPKSEYINFHNFCFHLHQILIGNFTKDGINDLPNT
jgi:hypothetical protein